MDEDKKITFTESKTAYRTINGVPISDEEWENRLKESKPERSDEISDVIAECISKRMSFVLSYCLERNWPLNWRELSFEQIQEIRNQEEWKTPQ